jgi:Ca-activated chloride channel homolog
VTKRVAMWLGTIGLGLAGSGSFALAYLASRGGDEASRWERGTLGVVTAVGVALAIIGGLAWWYQRHVPEPESEGVPGDEGEPSLEPRRTVTKQDVARALLPWGIAVVVIAGATIAAMQIYEVRFGTLWSELGRLCKLAIHPNRSQEGALVEWKSPRAVFLVAGAALVGFLAFHLRRRRSAAMAYSQVAFVRRRGIAAWLADLPSVLRVVAVAALAIALARPETYRIVKKEVDSIDIMLVVDMSKSMEEQDMQRDRLDAAQRVIRRFLHHTKNDRIGLVIFGQQAMLQCPLTQDTKLLEQIVSDLAIGDVPELGTAIGDGLALGLAQLRRSDAKSKVVILLSDGDTNWVTRFDPDQAARAAKEMGVKVYTLLVGSETSDLFGGMSVNPATLRNIAETTGGEFFRASDYESFDHGFQTVRKKLDTTKRTITQRMPDKQLFIPFAALAALLIAAELLLANTRLRRLP